MKSTGEFITNFGFNEDNDVMMLLITGVLTTPHGTYRNPTQLWSNIGTGQQMEGKHN